MGKPSTKITERLGVLSRAVWNSTNVLDDDRAARNAAIVEADVEGYTLHQIAQATEMSVSHVQRIVLAACAQHDAAPVEMET